MVKIYLLSVLVAFTLSVAFCFGILPILRRLKAGQNILSYVKEHKKKNGTPTMGGLAFVTAAVAAGVIFIPWLETSSSRVLSLCFVIGLAYMLIGLLDDYLKMRRKENLGLYAWQKFTFQGLVAIFCGIFCLRADLTEITIPFFNVSVDIGGWIFPLCIFAFLATVNGVNLTDGLDGLAASTCVPYFLAMGILVALDGKNQGVATLSFALVGALLGYLLFNVSPASVFMGDTGSLSLGGFAAAIACFTGNVLYIAILGACFAFSVISVVVQVIYYKATHGKRIFLMAPVHHHFQQKGYSESRISYAYFCVSAALGLLCVLTAI